MALATHPFVKIPHLTAFDRFELTLSTAEKCLNTAAYCIGLNFVAAPIKFGIGVIQTVVAGIALVVNKISLELKELYYNKTTESNELANYTNCQNRTKFHIQSGFENTLRSLTQLIPFLNFVYCSYDSRRMNNDNKSAYEAEKKVLDYKQIKPSNFVPWRNHTLVPLKWEEIERVIYGIEKTFRVIGQIPAINLISGALHLIYSYTKITLCLITAGIVKMVEGCCSKQRNRQVAERIFQILLNHFQAGVLGVGDSILEILYPLNFIRQLKLFPTYSECYEGLANFKNKFYSERPSPDLIRKIYCRNLRTVERRVAHFENYILNISGYIPLISTFTGPLRVLLGVAQVVFGVVSGVFYHISNGFCTSSKIYWETKFLKSDLYDFAFQGFLNVIRGSVEVIPLLSLINYKRDHVRYREPKKCYYAYINEKLDDFF